MEVVNLSVVGNPNGFVLITHRHVTGTGKVDDTQPAVPESEHPIRGYEYPPVIGAPMRHQAHHSVQKFGVGKSRRPTDSTHALVSSPKTCRYEPDVIDPVQLGDYPLGSLVSKRSERWSATTRLVSSDIERSEGRSPLPRGRRGDDPFRLSHSIRLGG